MSKSAATKYLRISQIAERIGMSARALRLYEARGLLAPDARSANGYRLYGAQALARLAEIAVLRRAGFTLAEIGTLLLREAAATALIEARIVALRREVRNKSAALATLEQAWRRLDPASSTDIEQLLEGIRMSEELDVCLTETQLAEFRRSGEILGQRFTPEEREQLRLRAERHGAENMQKYQQQWSVLIAQVGAAMDAGTPTDDPAVIELGRRWHALVNAFSGGDAGLVRKMKDACQKQPRAMATQGMEPAMFVYIGEVMQAAGLTLKA
jgi:MerR family transcriptional regulator, thiopeptide resistance regulator